MNQATTWGSAGGRACPVDYVYPEGMLAAVDDGTAQVLYVVGNLYGNTETLRALMRRKDGELGQVRIIFGSDFHWLDVGRGEFAAIAMGVSEHEAITGNAEREMARQDGTFGCGCAYPDWVDPATTQRSNEIATVMARTAACFPEHLRWLAALPMCRAVRVGGERVLVVHGDTRSRARGRPWTATMAGSSGEHVVMRCPWITTLRPGCNVSAPSGPRVRQRTRATSAGSAVMSRPVRAS